MNELTDVFADLRARMLPCVTGLPLAEDSTTRLSVDTSQIMKNGKPLWFGGVEIRKRYVSYHLMPVYVNPALLEAVSPALRKKMQGKSCFSFARIEPDLFEELASLTAACREDYRRQGFA